MIHIEKDKEILENPNLKVASDTGDYEDETLINFYDKSNKEVILGSFQAQYVKYGGMIYRFNDKMELGEAILKIDPNSTHTAVSYVRMSNDLRDKMNNGSLGSDLFEKTSVDEQVDAEETIEEKTENEVKPTIPKKIKNKTNNSATIISTPEIISDTVETNTSTTTPSILETPSIPEEIVAFAKKKIAKKLRL